MYFIKLKIHNLKFIYVKEMYKLDIFLLLFEVTTIKPVLLNNSKYFN